MIFCFRKVASELYDVNTTTSNKKIKRSDEGVGYNALLNMKHIISRK